MSRIGRLKIKIPKNVLVVRDLEYIKVQGSQGLLEIKVPSIIDIQISEAKLILKPNIESRIAKAYHGLFRTLLNNMVIGVSKKFTKILELKGVGYRCQLNNNSLILNLGYSHPIEMHVPNNINIIVDNNTSIIITGIEKEQVGLFASKIRGFRPPEPYNGKGVLYKDEIIIRKTGKVGK